MGMTNREIQEAYRERMYAAGYKQIRLWVPRDSEGKGVKTDRRAFIARLDTLTAGWSRTRLAQLFNELLAVIKMKTKEVKRQK
jgi:hypothetical protein